MPRFETSDDKIFELSSEVIKYSSTMNNVVADFGDQEGNDDSAIPLPNVHSREFERIVIYLNYLNEMELKGEKVQKKKTKGNKNKKIKLTEWDNKFLAIEKEQLFELYKTANYLEIEELLNICSKYIAEIITGKDVDWTREYFGEPDDLTPEEKEKIKEENKWINDVQN